jgi:hypothetical protein
MRIAVPYRRHVVIEVDISAAILVEDVGALPPHQLNRATIK